MIFFSLFYLISKAFLFCAITGSLSEVKKKDTGCYKSGSQE